MNKKTEKLVIKIFGNFLFGITVYAFILILAMPSIIFFSIANGFDFENLPLLGKLIVFIVFVVAFFIIGAIQIIWAWLLLSIADAKERNIPVRESLANYKDQWNKTLKKFLKESYMVD